MVQERLVFMLGLSTSSQRLNQPDNAAVSLNECLKAVNRTGAIREIAAYDTL